MDVGLLAYRIYFKWICLQIHARLYGKFRPLTSSNVNVRPLTLKKAHRVAHIIAHATIYTHRIHVPSARSRVPFGSMVANITFQVVYARLLRVLHFLSKPLIPFR